VGIPRAVGIEAWASHLLGSALVSCSKVEAVTEAEATPQASRIGTFSRPKCVPKFVSTLDSKNTDSNRNRKCVIKAVSR